MKTIAILITLISTSAFAGTLFIDGKEAPIPSAKVTSWHVASRYDWNNEKQESTTYHYIIIEDSKKRECKIPIEFLKTRGIDPVQLGELLINPTSATTLICNKGVTPYGYGVRSISILNRGPQE